MENSLALADAKVVMLSVLRDTLKAVATGSRPLAQVANQKLKEIEPELLAAQRRQEALLTPEAKV